MYIISGDTALSFEYQKHQYRKPRYQKPRCQKPIYQKPIVDRCFLPSPDISCADLALSNGVESQFLRAENKGKGYQENRSRKRVLIVDDHEDSLTLARYVVEEEGHHVATALSGHHAVEMAISYQPELILLDIVLDDISGLDIFRQIKQYEQFAQTPVVAVTALTQQSVQKEAAAIGFSDYLFKPYHIEDLCRLVRKYCGEAVSYTSVNAPIKTVSITTDES